MLRGFIHAIVCIENSCRRASVQRAVVRMRGSVFNHFLLNTWAVSSLGLYSNKLLCAGVQPRLIQGIRSGDGVGDLFNYLFIKDIKSNRMRIAQ